MVQKGELAGSVTTNGVNLLEKVCPRCGYDGQAKNLLGDAHVVRDGAPPHGQEVRCGGCGAFLGYMPKEGRPRRRRDRNRSHRALWLQRHEGDLICCFCGARRSERPRVAWDIDHLVPLEDGGPDEVWNTAPLCRDCHAIKGAIRSSRRHAEERPARRRPAA